MVLIPNLLLNLLLKYNASQIISEIALFVLALLTISSLTLIIAYFPDARPSFLLAYIPAIIFSSSQSLSFGIVNLVIVLVCFGSLTFLEFSGYKLLLDHAVDYKSMTVSWKVGTAFTFLFLLISSFMSFYFSSILRKRANKIAHLAELNKKLYQRSKTTSDEIFREMNEALVVIDEKFNIVQYNNAFKQMAGGHKDLINSNISTLKLDFIGNFAKYTNEANENHVKNIQFKTVDELKHNYTVNISVIDLAKNETGYILLIKKHALPWGTVSDSVTGNPIDLVLVRLMSVKDKRVIETKVTDREGRFGFIVPTGKYSVFVAKEGFKFPSVKSKQGYKGEEIEIKSDSEGVIKIDVPLDKV